MMRFDSKFSYSHIIDIFPGDYATRTYFLTRPDSELMAERKQIYKNFYNIFKTFTEPNENAIIFIFKKNERADQRLRFRYSEEAKRGTRGDSSRDDMDLMTPLVSDPTKELSV
jgi:hypothetical protein